MGKSKDLATGETRFVNTSGDTMTGNLAINNASGSQVTLHRSDTTIVNDDLVGQIIMSGDDADTDASGTRGFIRGRSQGTGGGLKMEFGTAGGGVVIGDPRMTINADGYVTTPNQPSFAVTKNNGHVTAGNVYIFNSTEYSVGSMYNTSNGRGTAPVAGRYFVSTWLMSEANATYNNKSYQIRKNGSIVKSVYSANGGNNHHQWSWAGLINLSANDYIDVYTDNMTLYGTSAYYSQFCMHLLS